MLTLLTKPSLIRFLERSEHEYFTGLPMATISIALLHKYNDNTLMDVTNYEFKVISTSVTAS